MLAAIDAVLHLTACIRQQTKLRTVTKILFIPLLLAAYFSATHTLLTMVAAALLLGWLGDVFLLGSRRFFFFSCGTLCFALGHFCYGATVFTRFSAMQSLPLPALLLLCVGSVLVPLAVVLVLRRKLKGEPWLFVAALPCYLFVLTLLCAAGLTTFILTKTLPAGLVTLGAISFLCSDIRLITLYVRRNPMAGCSDFAVMLTYFLAQTLLLIALCL